MGFLLFSSTVGAVALVVEERYQSVCRRIKIVWLRPLALVHEISGAHYWTA